MTTKEQKIISLLNAKNDIRKTIYRYQEELVLLKGSKSIKLSVLLDFADNITLTNKSMKGWLEGMPLGKSNPPAPQPEQMRDSLLQKHRLDNKHVALNGDIGRNVNDSTIGEPLRKLVDSLKRKSGEALNNTANIFGGGTEIVESTNDSEIRLLDSNKARKFNISFEMDSDDD